MAKILVADDNSNIQKMVGLALKDHGIEVVAVGNGEAAVRKISDIRPDLVLADVFMPVRNGYEVCKYVKDDTALAHIPVILLVGAFDPLDEQEAQNVGADGVLKKPFVPPDPLISMVKSALVRAGVAHAGFTPEKPAPPAELEPAPVASAPKPPVSAFEMPKPVEPGDMGSFVDEVPARPADVKIEAGGQPAAFGSLLGTPDTASEEEAPELAPAPVNLRMERDWRSAKVEEEEEEEEPSAKGSWRRDGGGDEEPSFVSEAAGEGEEAGADASHDFRHPGGAAEWTPTREKSDIPEPEPEGVPAGMMDRPDLPANPPFSGEAWAAAIDTESSRKTAIAEEEHPAVHAADLEKMIGHVAEPVAAEKPAPAEQAEHVASPADAVVEEAPVVAEPAKNSGLNSWFSTPPPNPWEAEAQKANRLASAWDTGLASPTHSDSGARGDVSFESAGAPDEIEVVPGANSEIVAAAAETVREETSHAAEQVERQADENLTSADANTAIHDAAANMDMDAIVAKVFSRLSPGLLADATRDILKPVVEAVIREELNSKKA
ncbi:MAG TPA: response regulator [Candidatus Eisenbacteria bacterium]|nr:response regulator [Candidatus Eisenbacteria bacterium]HYV61545.1 response regulator [Bryobacteraceae bacterium]